MMTIGEKINEILKKHGEDVCGDITFEDAKNRASRKWKNVLRNPLDTKLENFVTLRKKTLNVEHWLVFLFQEMFDDDLMAQLFNSVKEEDFWIKDFIKAAICCEYSDIYFDMFD